MRILLFLFFVHLLLNASTINLDEILTAVQKEHPMAKSLQEIDYAHKNQNQAISSREAAQLNIQNSYANPKFNKAEHEYDIGVTQNITLPSVKKNIAQANSYKNEAQMLELKYNFALLQNDIALLYHNSCLDKTNLSNFSQELKSFEELYTKKAKAYEYKEISKKELLELSLELERLRNEHKQYKNVLLSSRSRLQSKVLLEYFTDKELSCNDLNPFVKELEVDNQNQTLIEQSFDKKIKSYQSDARRYNNSFDSFTLGLSYAKEIDLNKATVSLSIPLNFTASVYEQSRSEALHNQSAASYDKEAYMLEKKADIELLQKELSFDFESIEAQKGIVKKYEDELLPLAKTAYLLGENSAIEFLLHQREYLKLKAELTTKHKKYYQTLFELLSVAQIKE
ncbi:MAG: TolC family protein [Sulfurimonas sp.]|uniref:TolC family protein n=1 Tax=Sulfurimonas sp. TaxID=2022749 RepID=UPI00262538D8|nr:TolC family protein [Sulfurimonas sp.]MDD2652204.1 TolC family protein [Sulfurimonas sp.]MDD3450514.1 TolC family protein [Sulfurimonas sp.]